MVVRFSAKVNELRECIASYVETGAHLKPNAPENIEKVYAELMELMNKEYEEALV